MSTQYTRNTFTRSAALRLILAVAATVSVPGLAAGDTGNSTGSSRVSVSKQIPTGGRGAAALDEQRLTYLPLQKTGQRKVTGQGKPGVMSDAGSGQRSVSNDFWFYTADVVLFNDDDNDGHFHGIDLLFDADTYYDVADVYAAVFLSYEGGPWNEYAVTDDFTLFGASSDDEYVIVTELESGYPTGSYDLLIELYDAYSGDYLAGFGPEDSSELIYLPLEDYQRDAPVVEEVVVVGHGHGGGADGYLLLLALPLAYRLRRRIAAARRAPGA